MACAMGGRCREPSKKKNGGCKARVCQNRSSQEQSSEKGCSKKNSQESKSECGCPSKNREESTPETACVGRNSQESLAKPDQFFQSRKVLGLDCDNFDSFVKGKDVVMVMYYEPDDPSSKWTKEHYRKAAECTKRPKHAYTAVDCVTYPDLCIDKDVPSVPHFQLYNRGETVPFFSVNAKQFHHSDMVLWVENLGMPN